MSHNLQLCSPHEIRELLNLVFDDAELDAFCVDYFPDVYDQFGRGLRKNEKLTLLLGYCRSPKRFEGLLRAMHDYRRLEFQAFFLEKGLRIEVNLPIESSFRVPLPYEVALAHNFDLNELVTECLDSLIGKQGLIGFIVPCNSLTFLNNFCERLKHEWGRNRVRLKPILVIDPIHTPIDRAVLTINKRYKPALIEGDVLFAVQIFEENLIEHFWQSLCQVVEVVELPNRLIVIMTIKTNCALPERTIFLTQPHFRPAHVLRWVRKVVESLAWPDNVVQTWTDHIIAECSLENELQIDWVYDHLEAMLELLKQKPTIDRFYQELERRRQIYV